LRSGHLWAARRHGRDRPPLEALAATQAVDSDGRAPVRYRIRAIHRALVFAVKVVISPVSIMWRILDRGAAAITNVSKPLKSPRF
jgi:hypothetical protein